MLTIREVIEKLQEYEKAIGGDKPVLITIDGQRVLTPVSIFRARNGELELEYAALATAEAREFLKSKSDNPEMFEN